MRILVTGGTGYIGSHTCIELLKNGYEVVIIDNLINSKESVVGKIEKLSGKSVKFYKCDILDEEGMDRVFSEQKIDAVIHFAGLKEYCFQLVGYGLRRSEERADQGGFSAFDHQSLRQHQAYDRKYPPRHLCFG